MKFKKIVIIEKKDQISQLYKQLEKLEIMSVKTGQQENTSLHCKVHDMIDKKEKEIEKLELELYDIINE